MCSIAIDNLSFRYEGAQTCLALDGLNLRIAEGEFICIIGHSGCGKSTLLNLLAGLLQPTAGQISLSGRPLSGPSAERAVVFQHYSLFPWMTALDNVSFGIRQARKGLPKRQTRELAAAFLRQVGMAEDCAKYPYQLSGGMQQRVAIARALAMDAPVLLLDEPFGALDAQKRTELQQLLEQLWLAGAPQKTAIFVTHDIEEAVLLADRIVFMRPGRIAAELTVPFARPRDRAQILASAQYEELKQQLLSLFFLNPELAHHEA